MDINTYKANMQKVFDYLSKNLQSMQVGRATPNLLESLDIETSYGAMKLNQVGHVSVMDAHTLKVEAWDKSQLKNVEKAIYDADLGLTPKNEGEYILVPIPALNEERRQEMVKKVKVTGEDSKAQIRQIRQDAMKKTKSMLADKAISEDDNKNNETDIEEITKDFNNKIDSLVRGKGEELMTV